MTGTTRKLLWSAIHNAVAHPLLALAAVANVLHDWTAEKAGFHEEEAAAEREGKRG